ncbi:MAG: DUF2797 domain-containing protein [Candidatus Thermoplasmatota archaeon]
MFERADDILIQGIDQRRSLHVLEFYWKGFEPRLVWRGQTDDRETEEPVDRADISVGRARRCVGRFERGRHIPCPNEVHVEGHSQCEACAGESYIWDQECVFDPKCDGSSCLSPKSGGAPSEFCRREHMLYLAFYQDRPKIGMSSSRRIRERLVEQGADAFAFIGTFPNRRAARLAEAEISSSTGLPQWHRQQDILDMLSRPVDRSAVEAEHARLGSLLEGREGVSFGGLEFLDGYPLAQPLQSAPRLQGTEGVHRGRFVGVKGKWLVYESQGLRALSMPDLVARFVDRPGQ